MKQLIGGRGIPFDKAVFDDHQTAPAMLIDLGQRCGESAVLGAVLSERANGQAAEEPSFCRELRVLGTYFHSHILRINGQDFERDMVISARELDCLKWTAAGKTAWEASVILGISERTVRFHLNAAREKLRCTTTTQAVATAVAAHMIEV